ncbi:MAG TPA: hypothetical protein VEC12_11665, partial [Bacteroidia bacterium]|nr:hypothetical protein [Bacteroidia bacterium]
MTLLGFIRLVIKKLPWLVIFPSMIAGLVIYLTKNMEREYVSSTIMYTGIASGYDITEIDAPRIDYFAVNNSFDNLINTVKSRETIEDVAMKLLTQHLMLKNPDPTVLSEKSFQRINNLIKPEEKKQLVVPGNFDSTYARIYRMRISSSENVVANLLNKIHRDNVHYSVSSITNRLTVNRKGSSDMLEMNFRSSDPGVTMHTLKFLLEAAQKRYRGVKGAETSNVVKYFEEQLRRALEDLRAAEERLKTFGVENRIINYYEQAKYIAASNEEIKNEYYKEMMAYEASKAAVDRLETRMEDRGLVITTNREFLDLRRQ